MKNSLRQFGTQTRAGFTLVELLVAVAILSVLTTLTLSAFNANDADRVSNSIGTFKNALEGARSRAISSGEVRGLRLIADPNDPRIVKSMVYIGSADNVEGIVIGPIYTFGEDVNGNGIFDMGEDTDGDGQFDRSTWFVRPIPSSPFETLTDSLIERELLVAGSKIELPASSGRWYTISHVEQDDNNNGMLDPSEDKNGNGERDLNLAEFFQPNSWNGSRYVSALSSSLPTSTPPLSNLPSFLRKSIDFRLELTPTILDGAEPILLDPQTCIDLDGSRVPDSWRFREDTNEDGMLNSDVNGNGKFDFSAGYSSKMDIYFAPDGTIIGPVRTSGLLNFRFAYVSDVILAQPLRERDLMGDMSDFNGTNIATYADFILPGDPEKVHKALTIFPQTGGIVITEFHPSVASTSAGTNNDIAVQPYKFARLGQESN